MDIYFANLLLGLGMIIHIKTAFVIDWKSSAVTGQPAKSSRFERDKFTGYMFAPFVDALTEDRTI